jgi:hypothetical protein
MAQQMLDSREPLLDDAVDFDLGPTAQDGDREVEETVHGNRSPAERVR